ncbi:MAG: aminotransferase class I/II-fold pyridoxal phosphate-dependent enzyme [Thermoguttaceae bacterium]|nr:aminotransferase class I/II-fold pyridoxal phosphate-dependent enzyme [Thermoguttaceae bacterium]
MATDFDNESYENGTCPDNLPSSNSSEAANENVAKDIVDIKQESTAAEYGNAQTHGDEPEENSRPFKINVSERVKRLPPYLFAELNALKYAKRRSGCDVIDLGMGSPSDPPSQLIVQKLAEAAENPRLHAYSNARGLPNLRREVAARYLKYYGVRLDPDSETIVTIGSKEGLSHILLALIGPGDLAIVPAPYFPAHLYGVMLASGETLALDVRDPEKLLSQVAVACQTHCPRPKLMLVNYPHNPTCTVVERDFYVDLVRLAKKYEFMVVSDLAYADITFDGYKTPSFLSVPGALDVGVEMTTMSKSYNMAGWRIGYCCGNREMIRALATIKTYYDYGTFSPMQIAAIVAIRQLDAKVQAQAKIYEHRRDILCEAISRIGWEVVKPKASMFVWQKIPEVWQQKMSTFDFAMKLLKEANVVVSPGSAFGPLGEGYMRLALVEKDERLKQAIRQIGRVLKDGE